MGNNYRNRYGLEALADGVRAGLGGAGPKTLRCKFLYDEVGSALFDAISALPEYGLTRAGERLMRSHADELVRRLSLPVIVAELGSGNGRNTRSLLEALSLRQKTLYCPIEISPAALTRCERELGQIHAVTVVGYEHEYLEGLLQVAADRPGSENLLVLFLGSTIGNFSRQEGVRFLQQVRETLREGDALLLAADLVKPEPQLLVAYDDPIGVTAAFNLNLLARINRELGGDFDISGFRHEARYNTAKRWIEMHLRSVREQTVHIPGAQLEVSFSEGETIWTESSCKYTTGEVIAMGEQAGFRCDAQWIDREWPFSHTLFIAER
jgi:L-histidine Nalpha-methyltransferase